jgi:hypothetical protein
LSLLNEVEKLRGDMRALLEQGAKREDVKAVSDRLEQTNEKVDALEIKFTDRLARLDVKVALGASLGSIVGGGAVALIVAQLG